MLDLVLIFMLTSIISVLSVWFYRKISGWHGFNTILVGRNRENMILNISPQQGFITLYPRNIAPLGVKSRIGTIRPPWGW